MKNSIFKTYSKRILRSEAFISVIVVFVLALGIIGTSYALYMDVDTDTDYQLVEVGDLKIDFDNADNSTNPEDYSKITLSNMIPMEDEIGVKQTDNIFSFRIYNTGTYTVDYDIKLVTADGNEVDTKYINYQICKNDATNCSDAKTLSNIKDSIIKEEHIFPTYEENEASVYYFIRVWVNNQYPLDTEKDNNIVLRVLIEASNASGTLDNKNTLAGTILNNAKIGDGITRTKYQTISNTSLGTPSNEDERLLLTTKDNDGISYYYRGNVVDNYMNYEGMCFRIVRILGNGNIKLVLADENNECNSKLITNTSSLIGGYTNEFNYTNLENNLIKWLNGETIITDNTNTTYTPKKNLSESKNIVEEKWCKETKEEITLECENTVTSKIGILTKEELIYAGSSIDGTNNNHYLVSEGEYMTYPILETIENNMGIRPSIVIDKEVLYRAGDGTIDSPYTIK